MTTTVETGTCKNCGKQITMRHPYPMQLPKEWAHAADGSWYCQGDSDPHAEVAA